MRQAGSAVYIHVVWATWDRLPLLVGEVERTVHRGIGAKCEELGAEMIALGGVEDHLHLLIKLPATLPIAELVKQVKGASSHLAAHLPAREFFKWQGAYGVVSVSPSDLPEVSAYIAGQRQHHAFGALLTELELAPDNDTPKGSP